KLLDSKLAGLPGSQGLKWLARKHNPQRTVFLEQDLKLRTARRLVVACVLAKRRDGGQFRRNASDENRFRLVERHQRLVDLPFPARREIHRPPAVSFVIWGVEAVVMEVAQRESDFVEIEEQPSILHRDVEDPVSGMLELTKIVLE